jgi:hypothetical protein
VPLTPQQRATTTRTALIVSRIVQRWRKTGYLSDTDQRRLQCALQNMRMACNSTWLLDHETDHGHKADELLTLLDELFEQPGAKAVVFSQWLGTHEVLMAPAAQQPAELGPCVLPRRRAGAERGVCWSSASTTIRTAGFSCPPTPGHRAEPAARRRHRGQHGPALEPGACWSSASAVCTAWASAAGVQVINLVAQGSIEEGMLSACWPSRQSLFDGVLDGGDSRCSWKAGVAEAATEVTSAPTLPAGEGPAAMAQEEVLDAAVNDGAPVGGPATDLAARVAAEVLIHPTHGPSGLPSGTLTSSLAAQSNEAQPAPPATSGVASATDPWAPLLQVGLQLLQTLARQEPAAPGSPGQSGAERLVHTDEAGQRYLKLPLPEPQAVQRLAEALTDLLGTQRR